MKEYIESIIEIILENVSCSHEFVEEYPRGPKLDNAAYMLNDEKVVIEKCIKAIPTRLIERPKIDIIFIGNKARELFGWSAEPRTIKECEEFLGSLLNELWGKEKS